MKHILFTLFFLLAAGSWFGIPVAFADDYEECWGGGACSPCGSCNDPCHDAYRAPSVWTTCGEWADYHGWPRQYVCEADPNPCESN